MAGEQPAEEAIGQAGHEPAAVRLARTSVGVEVWVAADRDALAAIPADGRPVVLAGDVAKLQGQPPAHIEAALRALRVFRGGTVERIGKPASVGTLGEWML